MLPLLNHRLLLEDVILKRTVLCLLCLSFLLVVPVKAEQAPQRGLFVSVAQDPSVFSSRKDIINLVDFAKRAHINVLFVQIYRADQAWFPSKMADATHYETCRKGLSGDPFGFLIREAHRQGLQVHAWLNLLSLGNNKGALFLKKYGPEILTRNLKRKKKLEDYKIDGQYFLEPGDPRVGQDLSRIVEEILRAYPDLDGIQFDYIRYPDTRPAYGYTKINIERFKKKMGRQAVDENNAVWRQWKRDQVTGLLRRLVKKTRELRPNIKISTTACVSYTRAYREAFQDWPSWLNSRLVDFVTIMDYSDEIPRFEKNILEAKQKVLNFSKVNIAEGAYKLENSPSVFVHEFNICEKSGGGACVVFHYGSLLKNPALRSYLINGTKP